MTAAPGAERARLATSPDGETGPWREWGPYLAERAWGSVREDYSEAGKPWEHFPHDHARSRAYRWSDDGLAGVSDRRQRLCLALALWNGRDPILKERIFGLNGDEGNHGEDAKEYWWYLDSTPTHSWMRWRYHYPQGEFPYGELVAENGRRSRSEPEYELLDTGVFDDDRYWQVTVDYAKAAPDDLLMRIRVRNAGPEADAIHVLPTLWFRNTWSWERDARRPSLRAGGDTAVVAEHAELGTWTLSGAAPDGDRPPQLLFCDNETNHLRLHGTDGASRYPKDGINDHVVGGAPTVNPERTGTKAAFWYRLEVAPGATAELRLRLSPGTADPLRPPDLAEGFSQVMLQRQGEADDFYAGVIPPDVDPEEAMVARQAFAGLLWSKQLYHFDVDRWLDGDPAGPPPPSARAGGRNRGWRHLNNFDVISMPDNWEYPWYAAWDLAFHCVALAHVDPAFAKQQLVLLCREWFMHPSGQLPAYEWAFDDVNPPVHAWAALRVFELDGGADFEFLERVFHKLLINFTWWVNRQDSHGSNVFSGGFLGLDNIGPINRSTGPPGGHLEQSDATAWMAMYCLDLLEMALVLAGHDPSYEDVATKFLEHFAYVASAMNGQGLWSEEDGFYYDVLHHHAHDQRIPLRVRSMVGMVPLFAVRVLDAATVARWPGFAARTRWFEANKPVLAAAIAHCNTGDCEGDRLLSVLDTPRLRRILARLLDPDEFLSPFGLRSLSRSHQEHPAELEIDGQRWRVAYEPGESQDGLFGGNSNWRGPVWFPLNYLVIEALRRFHRHLGEGFAVEFPTGSGTLARLDEVADELTRRLVALFRDDPAGRRPAFGDADRLQRDPAWHDLVPFHEYFHGETGAGLGASHQTGWTALVADLIVRRPA